MWILIILIGLATVATAVSPPMATAVAPNVGMEATTVTVTVSGSHFQNTTEVTIGTAACVLQNPGGAPNWPVIEPCLLQTTRLEACQVEEEEEATILPGELQPCDQNNACVLWTNLGQSCGSVSSTPICQLHRCLLPRHNQCYGFDNTPDFSWCADGRACLGGACVDARGESCNATIACTLPADNGLLPGLHNVTLTTPNGTTTLVDVFHVMPEPRDIIVGTDAWIGRVRGPAHDGVDDASSYGYSDYDYATPMHFYGSSSGGGGGVVSTGTEFYAQALQFSDGVVYSDHVLSFTADGVPFGVSDPFPALDIGGASRQDVVVHIWVEFADVSPTPLLAALNWTVTYTPRPLIYSLCPSAVLAFVDNTVVVQGEHFVASDFFECRLDGAVVPHAVINERTVHCTVTIVSNSTASLPLQITNDRLTQAPAPGTVSVTGACGLIKPNSRPVGDACLCDPGFQDTGAACVPCPDGSYQPAIGQGACIPCDSTEDTSGAAGSLSAAACRCRAGRFRAAPDDISCTLCGIGMTCDEGVVAVAPGYWRHAEANLFVAECPSGNTGCAGGAGAGDSLCARGYEGPLCSVCARGYGKINDICVKCEDHDASIGIMVAVLVVWIVVLFVVIRSTTKPGEDNAEVSTVVKIAVNYLQVLHAVWLLSDSWGTLGDWLLGSTSLVSISTSFMPVQCAVRTDFYQSIGVTMSMPVIIAAGLFVPYALVHIFRKSLVLAYTGPTPVRMASIEIFHSYLTALLITLYFIHPRIAQDVFGSLNCEHVRGTGTSYIARDMSVDCGTTEYQVYRIVAVLYIVGYIFGAIAFVGWRIHVNRAALSMARMIYTLDSPIYVYFVRGYSQTQHLWEGAVLMRKLGIVLCGAFLSNGLGLLGGLIIIGLSLVYTVVKHPYQRTPGKHIDPNRLDTYALAAIGATVLLGLGAIFVDRDVDVAIFFLLLLFNGVVVLVLGAATVSRLKEPLQRAMAVVAASLHLHEQRNFEKAAEAAVANGRARRRRSGAPGADAALSTTEMSVLPLPPPPPPPSLPGGDIREVQLEARGASAGAGADDDPAMPAESTSSRRGRITSETVVRVEDTWPGPKGGGGVGSGLPEYKGTPRPTDDDIDYETGLALTASRSGDALDGRGGGYGGQSESGRSSRRSGRPSPITIPVTAPYIL